MAITEPRPRNVNFIEINPFSDPNGEDLPCGDESEYPPGPTMLGGVHWVDSEETAFDRVAIIHNNPMRQSPTYVAKGVHSYSPQINMVCDIAVCAIDKRGNASLPHVAPRAAYRYDYNSMPRYFLKNSYTPSIPVNNPTEFDIPFTRTLSSLPAVGTVIAGLKFEKNGSSAGNLTFVSYNAQSRVLRVKRQTGVFTSGETGYQIYYEGTMLRNADNSYVPHFTIIPLSINTNYQYPTITGCRVDQSDIRKIKVTVQLTGSTIASVSASKFAIAGKVATGASVSGNVITLTLSAPVEAAGGNFYMVAGEGAFTDSAGYISTSIGCVVVNNSDYVRPGVSEARITNAQPGRLEITFNAAVTVEDTTAITLSGPAGYTMPTISGIVRNNDSTIVLTLSKNMDEAISGITLSYTESFGKDRHSQGGLPIPAASNVAVSNDINSPFAVEGAIISQGSESVIMLDFKQFVKSPSNSAVGLAVSGATGGNTVISKGTTSGAGTDKLLIKLANKALREQTYILSYTKGTGDLTIGTTGVKVESFTVNVTNNSQLVAATILSAGLVNFTTPGSKFGVIEFQIRFSKAIDATPSSLMEAIQIYIDADKEIT
jgi:hypothetical protein